MVQRKFVTYAEALERIGDVETLRQLLLTDELCAHVELSNSVATYFPSLNTNPAPISGRSRHARWIVLRRSPEDGEGLRRVALTGWFLVHITTVRSIMRGGLRPNSRWWLVVYTEGDDAKSYQMHLEARLEGYACEQFWFRASDLDQYLTATSTPVPEFIAGRAIDTRERSNMLRVIHALAVMARLPDRGAVTAVETQLQTLGFQAPKEATIRKLLTEARELAPD